MPTLFDPHDTRHGSLHSGAKQGLAGRADAQTYVNSTLGYIALYHR